MEDELLDKNDEKQAITRGVILIDCDPKGSGFTLWCGNAFKKRL